VFESLIFRSESWQMSFGERAAVEGVLAELRPELSIEIGTAQGGSLDRIAAHSGEVHTIDLEPPAGEMPGNVTAHAGDSLEVVPKLLEGFAAEDRNVGFVLIDGDHSTEGARADLENLLASPAIRQTAILMHDTMFPPTRRGLEAALGGGREGVVYFDLDFISGFVGRRADIAGEPWGGLGLVVVDREATEPWVEGARQDLHQDPHGPLWLLGALVRRADQGRPITQKVAGRLAGALSGYDDFGGTGVRR
jgi:hypothetical protein